MLIIAVCTWVLPMQSVASIFLHREGDVAVPGSQVKNLTITRASKQKLMHGVEKVSREKIFSSLITLQLRSSDEADWWEIKDG